MKIKFFVTLGFFQFKLVKFIQFSVIGVIAINRRGVLGSKNPVAN